MPYVIRMPHKRALALAASCCTLLITAAPAAAFGPMPGPGGPAQGPTGGSQSQIAAPPSVCPMPTTSQALSVIGDNASYSLLSGGDFSGPLAGWTLNNASVVSGGEPYNVSGSAKPASLSIAPGGQAASPVMCVSSLFPSWRFFAVAPNGGRLHISAQYTTSWGQSGEVPVTDLDGSDFGSWQATNALPLGSVLMPGATANVRFVFSADQNGGAWNIDDVYVDPYAR